MEIINYDEGVQILLPDGLRIEQEVQPIRRTRSLRTIPKAINMPGNTPSSGNDPVAIALEQSGFEIIRSVVIVSKRKSTRAFTAAATTPPEVTVGLSDDENAVLLTEQDGMYRWHFGTDATPKMATRKRGSKNESINKEVVFLLNNESFTGSSPTSRSFISTILSPIKTYILKFISRAAITSVMRYLEQDTKERLVKLVKGSTEWQPVENFKRLGLDSISEPKILLFIHGTFSTTTGAFGMFNELPWGQKFMDAALSHYDAVIGYDHRSLGKDPFRNAQDLLELLKAHQGNPMQIDIIAHSRGGLVTRSFIEKLLPSSGTAFNVKKAILVGATNDGTLLASPDNWKTLIDFYTNLTVGTARAVGYIAPQSKPVTLIITEVVKNLGDFVKYFATAAISDAIVPGLSAMEPTGDFILDINRAQQGQPTVSETPYYIISSAFKPKLKGDHEPKELPKRFLSLFAAGLIEQLMKEPNDLVVNTASMGAIDTKSGNFIKDSFAFGENPQVYHTNYFTRPEVADVLVKWLGLFEAPPVTAEIPFDGSIYPYTIDNTINLSVNADTDIIVADALSAVKVLRGSIRKFAPSYVVLQAKDGVKINNYAFRGEEAMRIIGEANTGNAFEVFNLEEVMPTPQQDIVIDSIKSSVKKVTRVLVEDGVPLAVVEKSPLANIEQLAATVRAIARPGNIENKILRKRILPTFKNNAVNIPLKRAKPSTNRGDSSPDEAADPTPSPLFRIGAEMDKEFHIDTTLTITVSREVLQHPALDRLYEEGIPFTADKSKKLIISVIPKKNIILAGSGRAEIDLPAPGVPMELYFSLLADGKGEGEVWVVARQENLPLVKLVMKPQILSNNPTRNTKLESAQDVIPPATNPATGLHQLWIVEEIGPNGSTRYRYTIYSDSLGINISDTCNPIIGSRQDYVAGLYEEIEERRLANLDDHENFQEELRAYGAELFRQLIPENIQKVLWENRAALDCIQVISSEPFIPWEFLHLVSTDNGNSRGMPADTWFLGQLGLVRWLDGAGKNNFPPKEILIRDGKVRYVIPLYPHPDYELPETLRERDYLVTKFGAIPVTPSSMEVRKIIREPGLFDLLHIACHGQANTNTISESSLLMEGTVDAMGNYLPDLFVERVAKNFSNLAASDNSPIVVLNACQTGRAGIKITNVGGFANAFLSAGAGVFVGTLWSVGDAPAYHFIEAFYDALLAGEPLFKAANAGRNAARISDPSTWLAYEIYGHPYMKIKS